MLNLAMVLDDSARKFPQREAVVLGERRLTYRQVNAMANQVANGLRGLGIGPGDHVALTCPNLPYFPIVYFGILKAGAVVVPLNVLLKGPEIAYHLRDSAAKAYFCFEGSAELPMGTFGREGFAEAEDCEHFVLITADPAAVPSDGTRTLGALLKDASPEHEMVLRSETDTAVILYTSGTTGRPKGAELTHSNMLLNAIASRDLCMHRFDRERVQSQVVALPLFHSFGQTCQMNAGFLNAGTLALVPRFDAQAVLDLFVREKTTHFAGVPTMYWGLLNHARSTGFDTGPVAESLQVCMSGGAPMPVEVLRAFEETFGVTILEGYGLSETSPVATFNRMTHPRKVGSIGMPILGVEVRVVDEEMNDVALGTPGEVVIRGHNIMKGYYRRPEATAEAMRGGWFHSGDIATMDEDGYLFIVDRLKDMIIRGGFNVYPREIEETLLEHPAISLAAVVGVPDEEQGEEIKAYVILKPGQSLGEEELVAWCRERMAAYKYPRVVGFRQSLPMTATGKILKRELRKEEQEAGAAPPSGLPYAGNHGG